MTSSPAALIPPLRSRHESPSVAATFGNDVAETETTAVEFGEVETFGIPTSVLDIASWDHEMILMWAEALNVSNAGLQRLAAASELTGVDLCDKSSSDDILGTILDEEDLQTAVLELEALRVLRRLQPGTHILHHHQQHHNDKEMSAMDEKTSSASIAPSSSSAVPCHDCSDNSTYTSLAQAESWLASLQSEMNVLYDEAQELLPQMRKHSETIFPRQGGRIIPSTTSVPSSNMIASKDNESIDRSSSCKKSKKQAEPMCSWGKDWQQPVAPVVFYAKPAATIHTRVHDVDAMCSDDDDVEDTASSSSGSHAVDNDAHLHPQVSLQKNITTDIAAVVTSFTLSHQTLHYQRQSKYLVEPLGRSRLQESSPTKYTDVDFDF